MENKLTYITVLQPGISSVQDKGRYGYLSEGVPISGFMDARSAGIANLLVGNPIDTACIEWAVLPPKLKFNKETIIAITGAVGNIYINDEKVKSYKSLYVPENAVVTFGVVENGIYGYLSIKGGVRTSKILGSRSFFYQITEYSNFFKGLGIPYLPDENISISNTSLINNFKIKLIETIEVYPGPEFKLLPVRQQELLFTTYFKPSMNRSRMGIQLEADFHKHEFSILSSPVLPGTVQWTPSGKLIVLMNDAQTIGGYPRLLQLSSDAIVKIAQHKNDFVFVVKN